MIGRPVAWCSASRTSAEFAFGAGPTRPLRGEERPTGWEACGTATGVPPLLAGDRSAATPGAGVGSLPQEDRGCTEKRRRMPASPSSPALITALSCLSAVGLIPVAQGALPPVNIRLPASPKPVPPFNVN